MGHGDFYWDIMMSKIGYGHLVGYNTMGFQHVSNEISWEIAPSDQTWLGNRRTPASLDGYSRQNMICSRYDVRLKHERRIYQYLQEQKCFF